MSTAAVDSQPISAPSRTGTPVPGDDLDRVRVLHTLGPAGTNLEAAAQLWLRRREVDGEVKLHTTLEGALPTIPRDGRHALVACAVYPALHTLVFSNLGRLRMVDSFISPTYNMVLASNGTIEPRQVSTHPAPQGLVPAAATVRLVTSNSQAALDCRAGKTDGCITTIAAAREHGLRVLRDYGEVPMVWTIHLVLPDRDVEAA